MSEQIVIALVSAVVGAALKAGFDWVRDQDLELSFRFKTRPKD